MDEYYDGNASLALEAGWIAVLTFSRNVVAANFSAVHKAVAAIVWSAADVEIGHTNEGDC